MLKIKIIKTQIMLKCKSQLNHNQKLVWHEKVTHAIVYLYLYLLFTLIMHICSGYFQNNLFKNL